jgi:hypothetical protein
MTNCFNEAKGLKLTEKLISDHFKANARQQLRRHAQFKLIIKFIASNLHPSILMVSNELERRTKRGSSTFSISLYQIFFFLMVDALHLFFTLMIILKSSSYYSHQVLFNDSNYH